MGFSGATLSYRYQFPGSSPSWDHDDIAVKGVTKTPGLVVGGHQLYSIIVDDGSILFDFERSAVWANAQKIGGTTSPASFNGAIFEDINDAILPIVNVKMETNIRGLTLGDLKFSEDKISIDFSGVVTTENSYVKLRTTFRTAGDNSGTGTSQSSITEQFMDRYGSPEAVNNQDFLTLIYQKLLDRAPDAEGYAYWNDAMAHGMGRADIVSAFTASAEFKANAADTTGDGFW